MRQALRTTGLVLLVLIQLACASDEPQVLHFDLSVDLPGLEKNVETRSVDLSSDEALFHLHRGFSEISWDEARERPFVRGTGKRSTVRFALLEPRDLNLVLRGRPVPREAAAGVEVAVNSEIVGSFELEPKLERYRVSIPASALQRGENALYLTYSGDAEVVAWYAIQFAAGAPVAEPPVANPSARSLFLPFSSQITVPLLVPPGAELRFGKLGIRGERGLLKISADPLSYQRALQLYRETELVLQATCAACGPVE